MIAVVVQVVLLVYHQVTSWIDLHSFNGTRNYSRRQKLAETGINAALMSLAPVGFAFHLHGLMTYGVIYYFVLFAVELIIWWVPYLTVPQGRWRIVYNRLLSLATSNFEPGDTLSHWVQIHQHLHAGTLTLLPRRDQRPVPNVEYMILHFWTLITAVTTLVEFRVRS